MQVLKPTTTADREMFLVEFRQQHTFYVVGEEAAFNREFAEFLQERHIVRILGVVPKQEQKAEAAKEIRSFSGLTPPAKK